MPLCREKASALFRIQSLKEAGREFRQVRVNERLLELFLSVFLFGFCNAAEFLKRANSFDHFTRWFRP